MTAEQLPGSTAVLADLPSRTRSVIAWTTGTAGLLVYNWWILVPLRPGLLKSPNELFSNLEVTGQPFAAAMQHADVAAGVLLLVALLAAGPARRLGMRAEWLAMLLFALGGALGGLTPETCADEINAACKRTEVHLELPLQQYLHIASGIVEFAGITLALVLAYRRTRHGEHAAIARGYRRLALGAIVGYPLLGVAYLGDVLGSVVEAAFFTGFAVIVVLQLMERTVIATTAQAGSPPAAPLTWSGPVRARQASAGDYPPRELPIDSAPARPCRAG